MNSTGLRHETKTSESYSYVTYILNNKRFVYTKGSDKAIPFKPMIHLLIKSLL